MNLSRYLSPWQVVLGIREPDKEALLDLLVHMAMEGRAFREQPEFTFEAVREAVAEREADKPTGLGNGVAFPHARIPNLRGVGLCIAVLGEPVDFNALDGQPARFVALIIAPQEQPTIILRLMSQMAQLLRDPEAFQFLMESKEPAAVATYIQKHVLHEDRSIYARDIMRPPFADIHPDTPLPEVTRIMLEHAQDTMEVVERDGALVGEITCDLLCTFGMPDFFSQLKSISFLSEFDPFERYFEREAHMRACDIMSKDVAAMPEDATLIEVLFELVVKRRTKAYVVRDGKRIGVLDRISVLDHVLNI